MSRAQKNGGRLVCLARQLRQSHSPSALHTCSKGRRQSVNQFSSPDVNSEHEISTPRFSPHDTSRLTFRCGHHMSENTFLAPSSGYADNNIVRSGSCGSQTNSLSYPYFPDCEAVYLEDSNYSHCRSSQHPISHCRSSSVGPQINRHHNTANARDIPIRFRNVPSREADGVSQNQIENIGDLSPEKKGPHGINYKSGRLVADLRKIAGAEKTDGEVLPKVVPPPPPPPQSQSTGPAGAQKRRARAIVVDRFSRIFFPLTFGLINCFYWCMFWSYL